MFAGAVVAGLSAGDAGGAGAVAAEVGAGGVGTAATATEEEAEGRPEGATSGEAEAIDPGDSGGAGSAMLTVVLPVAASRFPKSIHTPLAAAGGAACLCPGPGPAEPAANRGAAPGVIVSVISVPAVSSPYFPARCRSTTRRVSGGRNWLSPYRTSFTQFLSTPMRCWCGLELVLGKSSSTRSGALAVLIWGVTGRLSSIFTCTCAPWCSTLTRRITAGESAAPAEAVPPASKAMKSKRPQHVFTLARTPSPLFPHSLPVAGPCKGPPFVLLRIL